MLAPVEGRSANVPLGPVVERCTSNPVSLLELSCHETSIWLGDTALEPVLDGAFTVGPPALVAETSSEGAVSWLRSHAMTESSSIGHARDTWRRASIAASRAVWAIVAPHDSAQFGRLTSRPSTSARQWRVGEFPMILR